MENRIDDRAEREARQKREHFERMSVLAATFGYRDLAEKVRPFIPLVRAALAAGDEHLNTIGLERWDALADCPSRVHTQRCKKCRSRVSSAYCGSCGTKSTIFHGPWPHEELRHTMLDESLPWHRVRTHSLSDRVCVLKHVARIEAGKESE